MSCSSGAVVSNRPAAQTAWRGACTSGYPGAQTAGCMTSDAGRSAAPATPRISIVVQPTRKSCENAQSLLLGQSCSLPFLRQPAPASAADGPCFRPLPGCVPRGRLPAGASGLGSARTSARRLARPSSTLNSPRRFSAVSCDSISPPGRRDQPHECDTAVSVQRNRSVEIGLLSPVNQHEIQPICESRQGGADCLIRIHLLLQIYARPISTFPCAALAAICPRLSVCKPALSLAFAKCGHLFSNDTLDKAPQSHSFIRWEKHQWQLPAFKERRLAAQDVSLQSHKCVHHQLLS